MNFRHELERRKGKRAAVLERLVKKKTQLERLKRKEKRLNEAQQIIQTVAQATQADLEYRVSELVTFALSATFKEPYALHLDFVPRRGGTEADISISRGSDEENSQRYPEYRARAQFYLWKLQGKKRWNNVGNLEHAIKFVRNRTSSSKQRAEQRALADEISSYCYEKFGWWCIHKVFGKQYMRNGLKELIESIESN